MWLERGCIIKSRRYKDSLIQNYPGIAPMGAHSSNTNNWEWVVAQRRCLNDSTSGISVQLSILNPPEVTCIVPSPMFHFQPNMATCTLVAKPLQCSLLAIMKFVLLDVVVFE